MCHYTDLATAAEQNDHHQKLESAPLFNVAKQHDYEVKMKTLCCMSCTRAV